jgi:hypothetical protein
MEKMERNNQTQDIHGVKNSRFSPEERAQMSRDNEKYRAARDKDAQKEVLRTDRPASSARNSRNAESRNKVRTEHGRQTGAPVSDRHERTKTSKTVPASRNERVKNSSEHRRKQKKLQNNLIIAMLLAVAVAVMGAFACFAMTINTIKVTGSERYSEKTVLTAADLGTGDSILLMNPAALEHKIESKLPYIEKAEIKRNWPDAVTIVLADAVPSLAIDTGKGYVLMNNSCKVLDDDAVAITESALIKGVGIVNAVPGEIAEFTENVSSESFERLCKAFEEYGITGITEYDLTSVSSIKVVIDYRVEVQLGTLAGAPEKLAFCKAVIDETIASDSKHPMVIDVTADGKAYARRKDDNNVSFNEPSSEEITEEDTSAEAVG